MEKRIIEGILVTSVNQIMQLFRLFKVHSVNKEAGKEACRLTTQRTQKNLVAFSQEFDALWVP